MSESLARIAFEASTRTLDKQERVLDELRARTGILLGAASVAASFLGRPAADDANHLILAAALFSFCVAIGGSVYVLVPRSWFTFSLVGSAVSEQLYELRGDIDEIHRRLAYDLDRFWENDRSTRRLFVWFRVATVGLAAQIVLLLFALSGNLFS